PGDAFPGRDIDDPGPSRFCHPFLYRAAAPGATLCAGAEVVHARRMAAQGGAVMTKALAIAAGAGLILVYAAMMLLVIPSIQLAGVKPAEGAKAHTDIEKRGREIYVSMGCVYCHSQQPRDPSQTPADKARGWGRPSVPADYT